MKKLLLFIVWILLGFGCTLFDAWVLYAAYNLFYVNFTVFALPAIAYKNFLVFTLFYATIVAGKNAMKKDSKSYELDKWETYEVLLKITSAKLISLGLFWAFTLFF